MKLPTLTRLYPKLTPWERLSLIIGACAREDTNERRRLLDSAPVVHLVTGDHHGLADAVEDLAKVVQMTLLEHVANFWRATADEADWRMLDDSLEDEDGSEGEDGLRVGDTTRIRRHVAFEFVQTLDGFRAFCESHQIDADYLLSELPGYESLREYERTLRLCAFTAESELVFRRTMYPDAPPPTSIAAMADAMERFVQRMASMGGDASE